MDDIGPHGFHNILKKVKLQWDHVYLPVIAAWLQNVYIPAITLLQSHSISFSHSYGKVESLKHYHDSTVQLQKTNNLDFFLIGNTSDSHKNMFVTKVSRLNVMGR